MSTTQSPASTAALLQVDAVSVLAGYQLAQVDRETVGVVEGEGILAGYPPGIRVTFHDSVDQADTLGEGTQEGFFLLPDNVLDKSLLPGQLGISLAHDIDQYRYETAQERLVEAQEGVAVAHCTAQDAADDVTGLDVGGQLTVGYGE